MFAFLLICVADIKITFGNNFVAPLKAENAENPGYTFLNPPSSPGIFRLVTLPHRNSGENKPLPLEILQNCMTPLENSKVKS